MPILGVDTGGTFTDFYLIADDGAVTVSKRPSTPDDPARAILDGLAELAASSPVTPHPSPVTPYQSRLISHAFLPPPSASAF